MTYTSRLHVASALLLTLLAVSAPAAQAASVLVEAEGFAAKGGWVVDPQFADIMGSPFLMAHGLGRPVEDAVTRVKIPQPGTYRVWVRTRNWVPGDWEAPGRFQVLANGNALDTTFGAGDEPWHWQDGGTVNLPAGEVTLALHDLTGFNGRCDAILLTTDPGLPPNDPKALRPWRNRLLGMPDLPAKKDSFDLVVVGGGIAGCAAAIAAGEQGLKVALIHDRITFGGNASGEVRVGVIGIKGREPARRILDRLTWERKGGNGSPVMLKDDEQRNAAMEAAQGVSLFRGWRAYDVAMDGKRIKAVHARHIETGECRSFAAPVFVDATGDGWIGYWAGAEYRYGRESVREFGEYHPRTDVKGQKGHLTVMMPNLRNNRNKPNAVPASSRFPGGWSPQKVPNDAWSPERADQRVMGSSLLWSSAPAAAAAPFPDVPWATAVSKDVSASKSEWFLEFSRNDLSQIEDAEAIRDHLLRAAYGAFSTCHRENPGRELQWVAYILGKRESRRLVGDHLFTLGDIWDGRTFPDAVVGEERGVDLHYQTIEYPIGRQFPWNGSVDFATWMLDGGKRSYTIPFRSLYSKNIENLMMAGRCFSCSHVALGGPRIMNTTGQMGVAVGYAASLCRKHNTTPRGVYEKHLAELRALTGYDASGGAR